MKKMFTEEGLARLRPPPTGRVEYGDSVGAGLMLRVTANGVKTWSVLYKVKGEGCASPLTGRLRKGTQRRITLGTFPVLGVKEARELAIDVLQKAWSGSDTRLLQREAHAARQANTVEIVARRFIEQDAKRNVASWRKIERSLELHVLPKWGRGPSPRSAAATSTTCWTSSWRGASSGPRGTCASTSRACSTGRSTVRSSSRAPLRVSSARTSSIAPKPAER